MPESALLHTVGQRGRIALLWILVCGIGAACAGQSSRRDVPTLPETPSEYADQTLPRHATETGEPDGVAAADNTPDDNAITNDGATLGRVLFYDTRLSAIDSVSCASCHLQRLGFSYPRRFCVGFDCRLSRRHAMGMTDARY